MHHFPTESAPEEASATSCTWSPFHGNFEGSCMAVVGKGTRTLKWHTVEDWSLIVILMFLIPSHQAPLSLSFPGTSLPIQGPPAGSRETKVKGPRALWKVLKEAQTDPNVLPLLQPSVYPSCDDKVIFLFLVNCSKCFSFIPFFKTSLCCFLNKKRFVILQSICYFF